ncbi:MAG TPA: CPBP family intramembrane glutamic endopeptidase [Candidatus Edwardsbacteria bacterium]|nr:CPBP family intramembrane glutamic endopeptidase [Candidatus Edwardsbacteria bacterium]
MRITIPPIFTVLLALIAAGLLAPDYSVGRAYRFDRLVIDRPPVTVEVDSGFFVPGYREGRTVTGAYVTGRGKCLVQIPPRFWHKTGLQLWDYRFSELLMALHPEDYNRIALSAQLVPTPHAAALARGQQLLQHYSRASHMLGRWAMLPDQGALHYRMLGTGFPPEVLLRADDKRVSVLDPVRPFLTFRDDRLAADPGRALAANMVGLPGLLAQQAAVALLALLLVAFLARLARIEARPRQRSGFRPKHFAVLALLGLAFLAQGPFISQLTERQQSPAVIAQYGGAMVTLVLALLALVWTARDQDPWAFAGFTRTNLWRGMLVALAAGVAMALAQAMRLPRDVVTMPWPRLAGQALWYLIGAGLLPELFCRGYVQASLERLFGQTWGLLLAAWLTGLAQALVQLSARNADVRVALVQGLMIAPLSALALGFLYQRTRNIAAPALMRGVIGLIPVVFKF